MLRQLVVFAFVGGVLNVFYGGLYLVLREAMSPQPANAVALVVSTIVGTWAHRRVTFGVRDSTGTVQHQTLGLGLLAFGLAVTAGSLALLELLVERPTRLAEVAVLVGCNLGIGLVRFASFRAVMMPAARREGWQPAAGETA